MPETKRDKYRRLLLALVPEEWRAQGQAIMDAYEVAFAENVYCSWCKELIPIGSAESHEALVARMRKHALVCQAHPLQAEVARLKRWVADLQAGPA